MRAHALLLPLVLLLAVGPASAAAGSPEGPGLLAEPASELHPWSVSVPEEDRVAADVLFQQGNGLMKDSLCVGAALKYRDALKRWDHPNIHYNLAMALVVLDQPVEAYEHLQKAIHYGPTPLQQERFEHARNYLRLLEKQVSRVTIRCDVAAASVELDGQKLFDGPGAYEGMVRAGSHTVVASKQGLVTNHSVRVFEGGKAVALDLKLQSMSELTEIHRRFPKRLPWALIGAGAAIAGGGGGMHYMAAQKFKRVDERSRVLCPGGCTDGEPHELASDRKKGEQLQQWAVGAYVVGGTAIVVGGVLAYLNRTEIRVKSYESETPATVTERPRLQLQPVLDPRGAGVALSLAY